MPRLARWDVSTHSKMAILQSFLRMLPRSSFLFLVVASTLVLLGGCQRTYEANATWESELSGVCSGCPGMRADTLVRKVEGVVSAQYNEKTQVLTVRYDSTSVASGVIISTLNDAGYDVGDFLGLLPTLLDPCCVRSLDDLAGLLNPADTIGLTQAQKNALLDSLRRVYLTGGSDDIDRMLDAELGDINLDDILRDDLLGNGDDLTVDADLLPELGQEPNFDADDDADIIGSIEQADNQPSRPVQRQPQRPQRKQSAPKTPTQPAPASN